MKSVEINASLGLGATCQREVFVLKPRSFLERKTSLNRCSTSPIQGLATCRLQVDDDADIMHSKKDSIVIHGQVVKPSTVDLALALVSVNGLEQFSKHECCFVRMFSESEIPEFCHLRKVLTSCGEFWDGSRMRRSELEVP